MGAANPPTVFTTGYEGKQQRALLDELASYNVDTLIDVRAIAESSVEGFSADELAPALSQQGIAYHHLGELGDFQPTAYPKYMETQDWQDAYRELRSRLQDETACLLCTCADISTCHRRFLAQRLREDGHKVVHITPAGPKETATFDGA